MKCNFSIVASLFHLYHLCILTVHMDFYHSSLINCIICYIYAFFFYMLSTPTRTHPSFCDSSSLVQKYMSGGMESVWTCVEDGGDPPSTTQTTFHQLSCHISTDVKYLHTGLLSRLTVSLGEQLRTD